MKMKEFVIIGTVILVAVAIVALKQKQRGQVSAEAAAQVNILPRLVDLGAGKCIPCKAMKPILEELAVRYAARFKTEFIDVREQADEAAKYGIKLIPTQIFFDAAGKELFRHEGFFSKEDILAKWKELGVSVE